MWRWGSSKNIAITLCAGLVGGLGLPLASGKAPPPTATAGRTDPLAIISQELTSSEPLQQQEGMATIRRLVTQGSLVGEARQRVAQDWLPALLGAKRYTETNEIALAAILSHPDDTALVEACQKARVRALLGSGNAHEALVNAKSLFNVASLKGTGEAIALVVQCLQADTTVGLPLVDRFKTEQEIGVVASSPAKAGSPTSSVLSSVVVDAAIYQKTLKECSGQMRADFLARGNLLLLAGQVAEAREMFEGLYAVATPEELPQATENIARCIKAADGHIVGANAWLSKLRPVAATSEPMPH